MRLRMRTIVQWAVTPLLFGVLGTGLSSADTPYNVSGTIVSASSTALGIAVGDAFSVTLAVDAAAAVDLNPLPNTGLYRFDSSPMTAHIGGHTFSSTGLFVLVQNQAATDPPSDFVTIQGVGPFVSSAPAPYVVVGLTIGLTTTDVTMLSNGDFILPTDLERFDDQRLFAVTFRNTVDASFDTVFGLIGVTSPSAEDQLEALMTSVNELGLPPGIGTSLNSKLGAALVAFSRGDTAAACGLVQAFEYEVRAQAGKKLTPGQAGQLIDAAFEIQSEIECS